MSQADRKPHVALLAQHLGVEVDLDLLDQATTHRSWAYEHGGAAENERLEFLGDAVLGLAITERLYKLFPEVDEGHLAKLRAAVVNARACAEIAVSLDLGAYMLLGRGEEVTGGRAKTSILADAMEAVLGAVYLSCGLDVAKDLILRLYADLIAGAVDLGAGLDWKTSLQEAVAEAGLGTPQYAVSDSGPDHAKEFSAQVLIAGTVLGAGTGRSKKLAEQQAAERAYGVLRGPHDA